MSERGAPIGPRRELLLSIEENERQVIAAGRLLALDLDKGLLEDGVARSHTKKPTRLRTTAGLAG
jgi:hypothetical protein